MTAFEFMAAWNRLKGTRDIDPFVDLLDSIEPTELPKVISNKLDSDFLMLIVRCIRTLVSRGVVLKGFELLRATSTVARFDTITMFLSDTEKSEVRGVFEEIAAVTKSPVDSQLLANIRRKFTGSD